MKKSGVSTTYILQTLLFVLVVFGTSCDETIHFGISCLKDTDCSDERICQNGTCVSTVSECIEDDECPDDSICMSGKCREALCETDCNCTSQRSCQDGRCVLDSGVCESNNDCTGNEICMISDPDTCSRGHCSTPVCETSEDCSNDQICLEGVCQVSDCFWSLDCQKKSELCRDLLCQPYLCLDHWDCQANEVCRQGQCEAIECPARTCPKNSYCSKEGFCRYAVCHWPDDCPETEMICQNQTCLPLECKTDADCLPIEQCSSGICKLLP